MQNCFMKAPVYSIPYYSSSLFYFCTLYLLYNLAKVHLDLERYKPLLGVSAIFRGRSESHG